MKRLFVYVVAMLCMAANSFADTVTIRYTGLGEQKPLYVVLVQAKDGRLYPGMKVKGLTAGQYAMGYKIDPRAKIVAQRPNAVYSDRKVDTYVVASMDPGVLQGVMKGDLPASDPSKGLIVKKIGQILNKNLYFYYGRDKSDKSEKLLLYTSLRDLNQANKTGYEEDWWNRTGADYPYLRSQLPEDLQAMPTKSTQSTKVSDMWREIGEQLISWEGKMSPSTTAQDFFDAWSGYLSPKGVTVTVNNEQVVFEPKPPKGSGASKVLASINKKLMGRSS